MKPLVNNEGLRRSARSLQRDHQIRPAERDQPRRRRHPQPVHLRPVRAVDRLGRHRLAGHRQGEVEGHRQGRRDDHAGLEDGARPRIRQTRRLHGRPLPLRHGRRQPCSASRLSAAGRGGVNAKADPKVKDAAYAFFSYMSAARAVQCRRDDRRVGLQPVPALAVPAAGQLDQGRHERGCGQELSRRHPGSSISRT